MHEGSVVVRDHPDPAPAKGEILVKVRAAGLNGADILQMRGTYPPPPGWPRDIPGMELAGEVVGLGPGAGRFQLGDRVMAVVGGGAQAELAVVHEREAMPVPEGLGWAAAGGLPEVFTTAHDALFTQAELAMGERLLVNGAAGGVGTAAVQIGAAAGADVVASVRDPARREEVARFGPGVTAIDPADMAAHGPYDVVLELVGAPNLMPDLKALATGGRISVIGTGAGAVGELHLGLLMIKRARIHGSTLRARPLEGKAAAARLVEAHVLPLFAGGKLEVPVCATFPLEEAAAAYERFQAGSKLGKIVLAG